MISRWNNPWANIKLGRLNMKYLIYYLLIGKRILLGYLKESLAEVFRIVMVGYPCSTHLKFVTKLITKLQK